MKTILIYCTALMLVLFTACGSNDEGGKSDGEKPNSETASNVENETKPDASDPEKAPERKMEAEPTENASNWLIVADPATLGTMDFETSHAQLKDAMADQVAIGEIFLGEGETIQGTIVYGGTDEEVRIEWKDETMTTPLVATVSGKSSRWHIEEGPVLGMTLAQLEAANGGPFSFTGCCWDYEGGITSWEGGSLSKYQGKVFFRVEYPKDATNEDALIGDKEVKSNSEAAQKYKDQIKVHEVSVKF